MNDKFDIKHAAKIVTLVICSISVAIIICWAASALDEVYSVWASSKDGQAQLAEADYNRQIAVREATAKAASATELAKAEIIRAKGVAKANKIIGKSLQSNEGYLTYLWIQSLDSKFNKVIYVPTKGNLPILEAGRFGAKK
jgi:regulator of protease activity HflC (stomatin/prohibitin superfamily)